MRCHVRRLVRSAVLIVSCLLFIYVVHTVFIISDNDSLVPQSRLFGEDQDHVGRLHTGVAGDSVGRLPKDKDVLNDEAHGGIGADKARTGVGGASLKKSNFTAVRKEAERSISTTKDGLAAKEVPVGKEGYSLRAGAAVSDVTKGRDVSSDALKQADDVDSYADVTYPPYVETLPPGVKGR